MVTLEKSRWWILFSLALGLLAVGLDMTVLNVALPTLAMDLQASTSELQWILDSYNLVLAAMLLPAGMLGDRYGRKKLLLASLFLFGGASAACAFSDTPAMLIGMRSLLGLGAAFLMPLSISVLPVLFKGADRTKAMMVWMTVNMLGIPLGPIVGGWLLNQYNWGSVFLINLPLIAIALIAVGLLMPESHSPERLRLDIPGVLGSSAGLVGITYGVIRVGEYGWDDRSGLLVMAAGVLILILFVIGERRVRHPLIDLSLFRSSSFTWGTLLATCVSFAMFGLLFAMPQYFQAVNGADAFGTGLRLLPMIGGMMVGAKVSEAIIKKFGARIVVSFGFAVIAGSLFLGTVTGPESGYAFVAVWISLFGVGLGFALPTSMDLAIGELSAERGGVGSALIMALRQVGGAIGVAVLGSALNSAYQSRLELDGLPGQTANAIKKSVSTGAATARQMGLPDLLAMVKSAYIHGMSLMLWICGGIAAISFVLAVLFLPRRAAGETKAQGESDLRA
ncbi:MFS transporter [Gorillibacterium timonense]|uniref:MFS transporter n=1 Tax=Gorillibacterium timonense TaxID=1689269 RepID=UPI00071E21E2|nr:MFS transporter [Gorillibacterium timonense]